jgi:hypothetical protein
VFALFSIPAAECLQIIYKLEGREKERERKKKLIDETLSANIILVYDSTKMIDSIDMYYNLLK